jgi:hypothetical protein
LEIDGRSEVRDFLQQQQLDDPRLFACLRAIFAHVAEAGTAEGGQWMRQLRAWPQQWEIRQGRHRFMGFVTGRELILCLYRLKQGQEPARQDLERVDRLRQQWSQEDE